MEQEKPDRLSACAERERLQKQGFRNVILLGLVSLFVDISTEMVYPLIPLYLTAAFGATPALVGVIEGIAESLASLLKVFSGYISDRYRRKKPLAIFGYATALVYKLALILSASWGGILAARVIDRIGKGVRTAPRDVLVSESAGEDRQGMAFGLHKSLDMAGSAIGIFCAFLILSLAGGELPYKRVFLLSAIPAVVGVAVLCFVRERRAPGRAAQRLSLASGWRALDMRLKLFLLVAFVFNLGNSSNAFLLLRAKDAGFTDANVVLLYLVYNVVSSLLAFPAGKLSDRVGRKSLLVVGYAAFSLVYLGFSMANTRGGFCALFALYGVYTALTAGVERALIAQMAPKEHKGAVLGLHATLVGLALLPASVLAGFLWDTVSPAAPFLLGSALAALSAVSIACILRKEPGRPRA